jgi:heterokaryon incompatibility protein (HET)
MWSNKNEPFENDAADLFSLQNAPLTVRDAIEAVLKMGRRYLWVDRYCINQRRIFEKEMMIHNMDLIYESAEATIVALHGDNEQSGLPGVSTISRNTQSQFDTSKG